MGKSSGDTTLRDKILRTVKRIKNNVAKQLSKDTVVHDYMNELQNNKTTSIDRLLQVKSFYYNQFQGVDLTK